MNHVVYLLAQTTPGGPVPGPGKPTTPTFLFPALLLGMVVFMMVMSGGRKKREQAKKKKLLDGLAKNDRILTIGGIVGTVAAVRDNEVVVKVDETTNAKMVFLKRAIQQVIRDDEEPQLEER